MEKDKTHIFTVDVEYEDESGFMFEVKLEGKEHEIMAHIMQITRGTLMAANAYKATAYKTDGFEACAYIK